MGPHFLAPLWRRFSRRGSEQREARQARQAQLQLRQTARWQRALRMAVMTALLVGLCGYLQFGAWEAGAREFLGAAYARDRGNAASLADWARRQIIIVTLSDDTFNTLGAPPPALPRKYHVKLIRELTKAGAKVIAFDLLFHTQKPEDAAFAREARASGRVVWGCIFEGYGTPERRLVEPTKQLLAASPHVGHLQVPLDGLESTAVRVEPAIWTAEQPPRPVLSLSTAIVSQALGLKGPVVRENGQLRVGSLAIPLDAEGGDSFKIKYYRANQETALNGDGSVTQVESTFFEVPYEDVLNGVSDDAFYGKNHTFKNKIVLVGNTTTLGNDTINTPVGRIWGVEVHAHAIATLLERGFLREASPLANLLALIAPSALICLLGLLLRLRWIVPSALLLALGYLVLVYVLFVDFRFGVHLFSPLAALILVTLGVLIERGVLEEREKQRATGLLQRHLSPQIAAYVLQNPDMLHTRRVTATVLFSDIRGFTALSERLEPEQVVVRLNEYFQVMTTAVFTHQGAVDKYIGDAIMALFNTPMVQPDHMHRAVATAIDMQSALLNLQEKWQREGLPLIDIGIGINTGEMVVGYMGARERLDFTVIGDAVNVASRVEGVNKELRTRILITAATYAGVRDEVEVRGPHIVHVKGKEEEVLVYEVLGWKTDLAKRPLEAEVQRYSDVTSPLPVQ